MPICSNICNNLKVTTVCSTLSETKCPVLAIFNLDKKSGIIEVFINYQTARLTPHIKPFSANSLKDILDNLNILNDQFARPVIIHLFTILELLEFK